MGAAQSTEDVPEHSSGSDHWHQRSKKELSFLELRGGKTREKSSGDQKKMTVPQIPTGTMKDLQCYDHRPPPTWIPPEPKSQELTNEQKALIESMIKTPSVKQSASEISPTVMNEVNVLKETTVELKEIIESMEEPMRQLKNEGFWRVDLFTTCKGPATKMQEKLNNLLCVSQKLQNYSDATLKKSAGKYWKDVSKVKSLSDKLLLDLSQKEAAASVECYKEIVDGANFLQKKLNDLFDAPLKLNVDDKPQAHVYQKIAESPYGHVQDSLYSKKPSGNNALDLCDESKDTNNENNLKDGGSVKLLETMDLEALVEKKTFYHSPKPSTSTDSKDFSFQNSDPLVFQQILSKFCEETIQDSKTYFKNLKLDKIDGSRAMALRHFMKIESDILNFQMRTASIALNTDSEKDVDIEFSPIISFRSNKNIITRHQENMKEMLEKIQEELGILEKRFKKKTTIKPLLDGNLHSLAFYILSMYISNQELKAAGETKDVLNKSYAFSTLTWMFRLLLSMETQETLPELSRINFEECIDSTKNRFDMMDLS